MKTTNKNRVKAEIVEIVEIVETPTPENYLAYILGVLFLGLVLLAI